MKTLNSTKETEEISKPKYGCEFCGRNFLRESTVLKHICEYKHRWLEKDRLSNRLGFQAWLEFYKKNSASKKQKTYEEFIKSAYYTAFVKFGSYCVDINALNVSRFADWLVKNQIKIDTWTTDSIYTKYLIEYLRTEDPLDAIHRSVEATIELAAKETIQSKDYLRYGNVNRICLEVTRGRISPWMLFQSKSGVDFMDRLDSMQVKIIIDYIDPEKWALKFHREPENVSTVKEILTAGGY
jgi:hypothetical protein